MLLSICHPLSGCSVTYKYIKFQVVELIQRKPEVRKISFIAHSVGGLVARYAIGRLYRPPSGRESEDLSSGMTDVDKRGTIAGLEAMNFITAATPHLGSRGHKQVLHLLYWLELSGISHLFFFFLFCISHIVETD